ncbi:YkgJ family cysteine cluster protein [Variovorax sp. PAMC 28711]|uniref:YkgJ family cysteine cluster protein n=1 Tax=Variovorax sp. PAMC 28711 TaxID=1795631 RepID=UPI00078C15A5|nr:YkgJ family cysteine cluster protein [Variovorax sp. PAMC 28711]AMM25588.1 Fe-S oxidoreductase [Variovorax sp. PAMC 28711]
MSTSVCQSCGACCAAYRVDFSVHELDDHGGRVPAGLAVEVNDTICRLRGTDHTPPRCGALGGTIGQSVACGISEWRPNPCQELEAGSDACERARARHGLPVLL